MSWCRCCGSLCTVAWRDTKDTNYAVRLPGNPAMQAVVRRRAMEKQAVSTNTLEPIVERYQKRLMRLLFRADAPLPAGGIRMSSYLLIAR